MHINLVGVNHRAAPVAVREKVAVSPGMLCDSLSLLRSYVPQGVILSTCNRTEIYTVETDSHHVHAAGLNFLRTRLDIPDTELPKYVYFSEDKRVVEHLFRVAAGLDSMVVGEYEVLGQVRHALEAAEKAGMVNLPLRHIFQSAVRIGRRVRHETEISKNALSVSSVAIDLAARVVGDLRNCEVLVIGTGEAGKLAVKVAKKRGVSKVVIASRTKERARALATTLGGIPIDLNNIADKLGTANIVITCAGSPHHILGFSEVNEAMEGRAKLPLVIIDIAIPRNVESNVGEIDNVALYNIDDLIQISGLNREQREGEVHKAEKIIAIEMDKFTSWWRAFDVMPVINALTSKAEEIRSSQLDKTLKKLRSLSDEERESLEAMTRSIVTKILKDPVRYLKENGDGNYTEVVKELFQLTEECP